MFKAKSKVRILVGVLGVLSIILVSSCSNDGPSSSAESKHETAEHTGESKSPSDTKGTASNQPAKIIEVTPKPVKTPPDFTGADQAMAEMQPTEGNSATGTVLFRPDRAKTKMLIHVSMRNVEPGLHGFHVHAVGDCSAPDGKSAAGHFAPEANPHGAPTAEKHHAGDLGNVEADKSGHIESVVDSNVLAFSGVNSVIGKAVILHAGADDLSSQPSGAAGARIACGVVVGFDTSQF